MGAVGDAVENANDSYSDALTPWVAERTLFLIPVPSISYTRGPLKIRICQNLHRKTQENEKIFDPKTNFFRSTHE